jgi:hypothetical protein
MLRSVTESYLEEPDRILNNWPAPLNATSYSQCCLEIIIIFFL